MEPENALREARPARFGGGVGLHFSSEFSSIFSIFVKSTRICCNASLIALRLVKRAGRRGEEGDGCCY